MGGGKNLAIRLFYPILFNILFRSDIWNLYRSYHNRKKEWKRIIWNNYMRKNAASISIDAKIGQPLYLPHGVSGIFITQSAVIGNNCVIFQQVTIGTNTIKGSKSYGAPTIGDSVYIGAGAKIIGGIKVGSNVRIGANASVVKNVPANSIAVTPELRIIPKDEILDNHFNPYLE